MSEHERPKNHPPITLFRIILWLLPTGFAVICGFVCFVLPILVDWTYEFSFGIWLALTCIFTAGAGWFNAALSNRVKSNRGDMILSTYLFFIIQVILIPLLLGTLLYAAFEINPPKF